MRSKLAPLLFDFAPVIIYYGTQWIWGLQLALIFSIAWVFGECAWKLARRQPLTFFFLYTSLLTLLFGAVDLYLERKGLNAYEPVTTNALIGLVLLSTLFAGKALLREATARQGRELGPLDPDKIFYLGFLAVLWALYFGAKAGASLWLLRNPGGNPPFLPRILEGNASLALLALVSIFGASGIRRMLFLLRIAPSARK